MTWLVNPIDLLFIEIGLMYCIPVGCWCTAGSSELLCTCFRGRCDVKYDSSFTREDF